MSFLRIENLTKAYPGVQALKGLSFSIEKGHTHALVGENGAGKSTLIKILSGAEQPDSGQIWLADRVYRPHSPKEALRAGIATIYQVFNLLPDRSIKHNVMLGKEPCNALGWLNLKAMRSETRRILEQLNSAYLSPDRIVDTLKVSEKQIVEIAKALVNQSSILIMDEPTSALNQNEVSALFNIVALLKKQGVTILYVSHRLEEIFQLADAVTVLRDGTHISTRPLDQVTRSSLVLDMIGRELTNVFPEKSPPSDQVALQVEGLTVENVLHRVSFKLCHGEVLAVAGLSGSGKTELGKALFGDLPLDSGRVVIGGKRIKPTPRRAIRQRMIYLPEDRKADGVMQELPIRRNISLAILDQVSRFGVIDFNKERALAAEQIKTLGIKTPHMEQDVMNLSGGNQQKVALGQRLAAQPEVLILTEPTQGIDIGVKFEIYQFIAQQVAAGHAVLLISSELTEILGLAHRILVMHDGRIVADLDAAQTNQEELLRYALGEEKSGK